MDFAKKEQVSCWFSHTVIGDCSFDTFERYKQNPIYTGSGKWEWPVNGFFYADPVSGNWYIYISLYCYGYLPLHGTIILMKSPDQGASWDNIGPVFDAQGLSREHEGTGAVDPSIVYDNGVYHMIYGWGTSDLYTNGGIAYAYSNSPEGPFIRAPHPLTRDDDTRTHYNKTYIRNYAATLLKRDSDWMILTCTSTKGNVGNTWAFACMTAEQPEGPYSNLQLVLYPQSSKYHPAPLEFFPAFVESEYVYVPATPVALNRNAQSIFRAKLEEAHKKDAWELFQEGSSWHAVDLDSERQGIWGQTLAGQVVGDELWVMYPALNDQNKGTINVAHRPWKQPYSDGFVLSANGGPSASFLKAAYSQFQLNVRTRSTGSGPFSVLWQWNAPVGADHANIWANMALHPLCLIPCLQLEIGIDAWRIVERVTGSDSRLIMERPFALRKGEMVEIAVHQAASSCHVSVNGDITCLDLPGVPGRLGLLSAPGTIISVETFELSGSAEENCWLDILPTDGLMQAGQDVTCWEYEENDEAYRFGFGYRSTNRLSKYSSDGIHMTKWIFSGRAFRLWMPVKAYGKIRIELDGNDLNEIELQPDGDSGSQLICQQADLVEGYHAVRVTLVEGEMICDSFSYLLSGFNLF